jgi:Holliday junction DNA helicase RuvA subunit
MIGRITGQLAEKNPPELLVDCQGVGYELLVPMSSFYNLPAVGETVSLLTHFVVREDAQILFGFGTATERSAFRQLIKIAGVGPRTALGVLSGMSVQDLSQAVSAQDGARLTKVPGIGKKTAERLLLEPTVDGRRLPIVKVAALLGRPNHRRHAPFKVIAATAADAERRRLDKSELVEGVVLGVVHELAERREAS